MTLEGIEEALNHRFAPKCEVSRLECDPENRTLRLLLRKSCLTAVEVSIDRAPDGAITATLFAIHPMVAKRAKAFIPVARGLQAIALPAFFFTWWRKMEQDVESVLKSLPE